MNWKQHYNDRMPLSVKLVFIVGIGGGWSAFHSEGRDLDYSISMGEWLGLFQWVRDGQGGSIKKNWVLCYLRGTEELNY